MYSASDLKKGLKIEIDGAPWQILWCKRLYKRSKKIWINPKSD